MATTKEAQEISELKKEIKGLQSKMDRLTRQMEMLVTTTLLSNVQVEFSEETFAKAIDELIKFNDIYEDRWKKHAFEILARKNSEKTEVKEENENA